MPYIVSVHHDTKSTDVQAGISLHLPHDAIWHFPEICTVHIALIGQSSFYKGDRIGKCGNDFVFLSAGKIDFFLLRQRRQPVFIHRRLPRGGGGVLL